MYNYNKPPRASPLVGLLNFSVAPDTGGVEFESKPAGFAFRQPLARDLRRAVTHRTHLFVRSLSFARAPTRTRKEDGTKERESERVKEGALSPSLSRGPPSESFDRLHSPWLRDWLILHSARIPLSRFRSLVATWRVNSPF